MPYEPGSSGKVTVEMLRQLAAASDLRASEERLAALTPEVQSLLDRVATLYELDVRHAQPTTPFGDETWG